MNEGASEEESRGQGGEKGQGGWCCGSCRPGNILLASVIEKGEKGF